MSQNVERVEVSGIILAENSDVENITVYNTSCNKGTITNGKGEFTIKVALNDIIEISALQFQMVSVIVDAEVIQSKQLKIQLIEQVNQLDAVLLSSGLSGNIKTDISNVKTVKSIVIDMGSMNIDFEYNDDKAFDNSIVDNHLTSILDPEARNYLPDVGKILKLLFKKNPLRIQKKLFREQVVEKKPIELLDVYSNNKLNQAFNIPLDKIEQFLAFIDENGMNFDLLKDENEVYLTDFLIKQSKEFLKLEDAKH
ncbi:carboxypeptidase-like regulatory domain-containing protein [Wocania ichthyoenteri]|uniref:carboxypeptidase-like regulatory domain-containing protein n=1 Tax=Wocania ichthyoenteri TaxID=1230531 RepID=UPI00068FF07C|nr:carboxypeptidase-like regulatory domain-containing protein [Wocania ichthyoenteri]